MPASYIRRKRTPDGVRDYRVPVARWVDPFYGIQGSSIEKMVMAELVRRGVYFEHTPRTNPVQWVPGSKEAWGKDPSKIEADFLLPQYRIWIEIQGTYFHSLPGQMERDALRFALIKASGWKPIFWWEDDIRTRLQDLMNEVPELYRIDRKREQRAQNQYRNTKGLPFYEGGEGIDHLKGLRAALAARARPPQDLVVRRRTKRRRK